MLIYLGFAALAAFASALVLSLFGEISLLATTHLVFAAAALPLIFGAMLPVILCHLNVRTILITLLYHTSLLPASAFAAIKKPPGGGIAGLKERGSFNESGGLRESISAHYRC